VVASHDSGVVSRDRYGLREGRVVECMLIESVDEHGLMSVGDGAEAMGNVVANVTYANKGTREPRLAGEGAIMEAAQRVRQRRHHPSLQWFVSEEGAVVASLSEGLGRGREMLGLG
jgi:hypothetical protein